MWFAKKMLRDIKTLDFPGKTLLWDGFLFYVWQIGELLGGRIKSPTGAIVLCSHSDGIDIYMAENWVGSFIKLPPLNMAYRGLTGAGFSTNIMNRPEKTECPEGTEFPECPTEIAIPFVPYPTQSPRVTSYDPPTYIWVDDDVPSPCADVVAGEIMWIDATGNMFIDLNENGIADLPKVLYETFMNFYIADGSKVEKRYSISLESGDDITQPWRIFMALPAEDKRFVQAQAFYYEYDGAGLCVAILFEARKDNLSLSKFYVSTIFNGPSPSTNPPSGLATVLLTTGGITPGWPLGNYAFSLTEETGPTLLHAPNLTNTLPWTASSPMDAYFSDNPGDKPWKLFYTIYDPDGLAYSISSSQFLTLLDTLQGGDIIGASTNWDLARKMMAQLISWPNNNWNVPYDSVMFPGTDNNIYSWTRKYGSVKFTRTGLFSTTLYMPTEVTATAGTRPNITYAGDGIYTCICHFMDNPAKISAIYYGNPFSADQWTKLTDIVDYTLIYARPLVMTSEKQELLGVAKLGGESFFCFYNNGWKIMGKLNTFSEGMNWSACLFGDTKNKYLSPPHVLPQMPVGPYNDYAAGMP